MARVTVEDALEKVNNRFELVLIAARRARQILSGVKPALVETNNDKETVIALREIADGLITKASLDEQDKVIAKEQEAQNLLTTTDKNQF